MKTDDYFTVADMRHNGSDTWSRVRAKLRQEGHAVSDGYGMYSHAIDERHYIVLSGHGNLVHVTTKPKGFKTDIAQFLLGWDGHRALKIRTGDDVEVVTQAFDYLVSLGYSGKNRDAILRTSRKEGLLADKDGVIYMILKALVFSDTYHYAQELEFDTELKVTLANFRPARKTITVSGVVVYEDAYNEFLKTNAIKSAT